MFSPQQGQPQAAASAQAQHCFLTGQLGASVPAQRANRIALAVAALALAVKDEVGRREADPGIGARRVLGEQAGGRDIEQPSVLGVMLGLHQRRDPGKVQHAGRAELGEHRRGGVMVAEVNALVGMAPASVPAGTQRPHLDSWSSGHDPLRRKPEAFHHPAPEKTAGASNQPFLRHRSPVSNDQTVAGAWERMPPVAFTMRRPWILLSPQILQAY